MWSLVCNIFEYMLCYMCCFAYLSNIYVTLVRYFQTQYAISDLLLYTVHSVSSVVDDRTGNKQMYRNLIQAKRRNRTMASDA